MITEFLGGPVIAVDSEEERHVLIGTIHGAFSNCKKYLPGIFVEVDDYSVLKFLQAEVFGSGLYNKKLKICQCYHEIWTKIAKLQYKNWDFTKEN